MSTSADDYDKLSEEERKIKDAQDRAREATEQAGMSLISPIPHQLYKRFTASSTLQVDPRTGGGRHHYSGAQRNARQRS